MASRVDFSNRVARCRRCAIGERGSCAVFQQLCIVPRKHGCGASGSANCGSETNDARACPRRSHQWLDAQQRRCHQRCGQAPHRRVGRWAENRQRVGRRRRKDDESLLESSAAARIQRACMERLGRRSSQHAIPDRSRRWVNTCAGFAPAIEVGVRIPRRYRALFPNHIRRTSLCEFQCRLRVLARRELRLRALGLPRAGRRAKQFHHRQAQPNECAARGLLRRYPRHSICTRCIDRRGDLEDTDGFPSARTHHRHAGVE